MSALSVRAPFPVFQDRDGQPLENGYVWLGIANLNPQTNPVVAYYDAALTIVAAQPLRTLNGYISRAGTPAQIYVDAVNYSIQVKDKNGSVVYTSLNGNAGAGGSAVQNATGTGTQTIFNVSSTPTAIYINGVYQNQNTYTLTPNTVTFSQAPPFTSIIEFVFG